MQEKNVLNKDVGWYRSKLQKFLKNKKIIHSIICGIILISLISYSCRPNDCQVLYDIMKELKPNMSRKEVLSIIEKHYKTYIHKSYMPSEVNDETISLWVYYFAFIKSCHLIIDFNDNKLYMAKIRGEDGPHEVFKDAPPDILLKNEK
jgi:hypothetical protein